MTDPNKEGQRGDWTNPYSMGVRVSNGANAPQADENLHRVAIDAYNDAYGAASSPEDGHEQGLMAVIEAIEGRLKSAPQAGRTETMDVWRHKNGAILPYRPNQAYAADFVWGTATFPLPDPEPKPDLLEDVIRDATGSQALAKGRAESRQDVQGVWIEIRTEDLHHEDIRADGQKVNEGDRGVCLTHMPTGVTAEVTRNRHSLTNRAEAIEKLRDLLVARVDLVTEMPNECVSEYDFNAPVPEPGSQWIWEPNAQHACERVTVHKVVWNGEQWWVRLKDSRGRIYPNELGRFWEAVEPAPQETLGMPYEIDASAPPGVIRVLTPFGDPVDIPLPGWVLEAAAKDMEENR
jgi:hypothetical protein